MPRPTPPTAKETLESQLRTAEAARLALAAELHTTKQALRVERTLRRFPAIEPAIHLIPPTDDDEEFAAHAETLARFLSR